MNNLAYVIHSGDKSEESWDFWYHYYKKHWTCKDVADTYFISEGKRKEYEGVKFICVGEGIPWSNGLHYALTQRIDAKYIIYQHEDYFLTENTFPHIIKVLIGLMDEHDMSLIKCCGWWAGYMTDEAPMTLTEIKANDEYKEKKFKYLWLYNNESPYLISHQTSIWKRDFLISTLELEESPWGHEIMGSNRLRKRNIPIYAYRGKCPIPYAETMVHGEIREGFEKYFEIDILK